MLAIERSLLAVTVTLVCGSCIVTTAPGPAATSTVVAAPVAGGALEYDVDRPGSDYNNFDLNAADPALCMQSCQGDPNCRAFTYVKPGVQGPNPRCWLKNQIPTATPNQCCVSGVVRPEATPVVMTPAPNTGIALEQNTDRPGYDFQNFDLAAPNPQLCADACVRDSNCHSFTYVNPGVQGPSARCWLKNSVAQSVPSNCCVSGVVRPD